MTKWFEFCNQDDALPSLIGVPLLSSAGAFLLQATLRRKNRNKLEVDASNTQPAVAATDSDRFGPFLGTRTTIIPREDQWTSELVSLMSSLVSEVSFATSGRYCYSS